VLLPALLLLASTTLLAQGPAIGIKVGASGARQQFSSSFSTDRTPARTAPTVSLAGSVPVRGPVALQLEAAYAPKGHTYPGGVTLNSDYLEVPLLLRVAPTRSRAVLPVALLGVAPAFELSCSGLTRPPTPGGTPIPLRPRDCNQDRQTRYDFSYIGAVGVDVPMRRGVFTAEVRYTHGVQNLLPRLQFVRGFNRSLSVLVGVRSGGAR
jgi:hypothetical protein